MFSWNSHFFYTELAIKNNDWINNFSEIEVTPYTYEDIDQDEYNPEFVIKYVEGEIGEKVKASDILINYSDEPDWDLDTNCLKLPLGKAIIIGVLGLPLGLFII